MERKSIESTQHKCILSLGTQIHIIKIQQDFRGKFKYEERVPVLFNIER
jgi:hypothetical protein